MSCSQTLKNDTLTHPSLWADYSEKMLRSEERQLSKLQSLKSGLMTDLLTGRVRVPEETAVAP